MNKIQEILKKIRFSLAKSLKEWDITEEDVIAYLIYFESLWEDKAIILKSLKNIAKEKDIFKEIENEILAEEKQKEDKEKYKRILQKIQ